MKKELTFKTNINCGSCLAKVSPQLNAILEISHWTVDTATRDKILKVQSEGATAEDIKNAVAKAGFKAEEV